MHIPRTIIHFYNHVIYKNYLVLLTFAVLIFVIYWNGLNAEFVSDDITAIQNQEQNFKSSSYILQNPFFFARSILFYISYQIGGITPFFFRIWNILFHIGTTYFIFLTYNVFSKNKHISFIGAVIYAVHPVLVESVTWISGGIYAQSSFFVLFSFYLFLKTTNQYKNTNYIVSVLLYICSLSSSEKAIIFPLILALQLYVQKKLTSKWKLLLPYILISGLWSILLITRIPARVQYLQTLYGTGEQYFFSNPFIQIPTALATYIKLFFWPAKLTLFHAGNIQSSIQLVLSYFVFLVFIAVCIFSFQKHKKVFFWLGFFLISLLPTLNPFQLSSLVAERYTYLGYVGLCFALTYFLYEYIKNKTIKILIVTVIILLLSARTITRNNDWQDNVTFWESTAKVSPLNPLVHNSLGGVYFENKQYANASQEFETAIQLNPNIYSAYYNLAVTYDLQKKYDKALTNYVLSIEKNPTYWQAYNKVSTIYVLQNNLQSAEKYLLTGISYNAENPVLYLNLGVVYKKMGNRTQAETAFLQALSFAPGNEVILNELQSIQLQP